MKINPDFIAPCGLYCGVRASIERFLQLGRIPLPGTSPL